MAVDIVMPHMGESVVEGTITAWLKHPGDAIAVDDPLVEIETDKINVEIPSPVAGVLLKVLAQDGETVQVDQVIGVIGEAGETAPTTSSPAPKPAPVAAPPSAPPDEESLAAGPLPPMQGTLVSPTPPAPKATRAAVAADSTPVEPKQLGVYASPAVRRFAREAQVDLRQVTGTGRMSRITRQDVQDFIKGQAEAHAPPEGAPRATGDDETIPLTPMRKAIAEHMVRSVREAPHVTTVAEVDMTAVSALRAEWKPAHAEQGIRLTFMAFILHAIARALKAFPALNASWTEEGIVIHYRIGLGLAVAVEEGLVVPVIRDADALSLTDMAKAVQRIAERTRAGKVSPSELQGGTFTITNPGVFGAVISTPIIHQPQAAILSTGRIADAPAVIDGGITIRKHMFLSLSYDHRIIDGATSVRFLQRIRAILEEADFSPSP